MTSIYVGNLAFDATEDDLLKAFGEHGRVESVNIVTDRYTGRPRGFAFVEMLDGSEAKAAIEALNLYQIAGRSITVNEARPREQRSRGGGGGGGHRRRRT